MSSPLETRVTLAAKLREAARRCEDAAVTVEEGGQYAPYLLTEVVSEVAHATARVSLVSVVRRLCMARGPGGERCSEHVPHRLPHQQVDEDGMTMARWV